MFIETKCGNGFLLKSNTTRMRRQAIWMNFQLADFAFPLQVLVGKVM